MKEEDRKSRAIASVTKTRRYKTLNEKGVGKREREREMKRKREREALLQ